MQLLPADVQAEATKMLTPSANTRAKELKTLAETVSLAAFGDDDSGDFVAFTRRRGKVDALTSDTFLHAFGLSKDKQEASDQYSFKPMGAGDSQALVDAPPDAEAVAAMERVRAVMEPLGAHVALVEDGRPFQAPVFLVARRTEGELFALRATVGGMGV